MPAMAIADTNATYKGCQRSGIKAGQVVETSGARLALVTLPAGLHVVVAVPDDGAAVIPIGLFADLIAGLGDPGIACEGGKPSGFVT